MKNIQKGREPASLVEHRQSGGGFDDAGVWKEELKQALLKEQGGLCCYCMGRIESDAMRVEHLRPQSRHPGQQLEYRNLLAACPGGQTSPHHAGIDVRHCDARKGNAELTLDPVAGVEHRVRYGFAGGTISSAHPETARELDEVLNLNAQNRRRARQGVLEGLTQGLQKKYGPKTWSKPVLDRELERWSQRDGDRFRPYCQVAVEYLKRKIRSARI